MATWHRVARESEVRDGQPYPAKLDEIAIALYRVNGRIHAVGDICTHDYIRLSGGALTGQVIECPVHHARFDVITGRCLARPAERSLATYPVRIEDGWIAVELETPWRAADGR